VRADVIGDQIVLVLVGLRIHNPESDAMSRGLEAEADDAGESCLILYMQYGMSIRSAHSHLN
jgi:hypothetical protein